MNTVGLSSTTLAVVLSLAACGPEADSSPSADLSKVAARAAPAAAPGEVRSVAKEGFDACSYAASDMQGAFGLALTGTPDTAMLESANLASCRYEITSSPTYVQVDYLWLSPADVEQSIASAGTGRAGSVTLVEGDADHASFQANTDMKMYALDYFRGNVMVTVRVLSWSGSPNAARSGLLGLPRRP